MSKLTPSNIGQGYILRRLIRRAVRYARALNLTTQNLQELSLIFINDVYAEAYPLLVENTDFILAELTKECNKFANTVEKRSARQRGDVLPLGETRFCQRA